MATIQYDGSRFAGSQLQPDVRTVQGELEAALTRLAGRATRAHFSGRTDAGVHAVGQVVHFDFPDRWTQDEVTRALRSVSPADIHVVETRAVGSEFDSRRWASARIYRYVIGTDPDSYSPFRRPFEWALDRQLDETLLHESAALFEGLHDFTAFSARGQEKDHYRCRIDRAFWTPRTNENGFIFRVQADRFLHHMVRFMVGTMVDVGLGKRPLADIGRLLASDTNADTSAPAPPEGLYLEKVIYPDTRKAASQ